MRFIWPRPASSPIPIEADDRALLRAVVWGLRCGDGDARRRCHLRNLSARGLLKTVGRGRGRHWVLTASGAAQAQRLS